MRTPPLAIRPPRAVRLSPLAAALAMAFALAPEAQAITITVTSNADSGPDTLYQAILDANNACETGVSSAPVINFSGGPFTISQSSTLPAFECFAGPYNPTVDGGGTPSSPVITLSSSSSTASCGLQHNYNFTYGGDLTILGMKVQGFTYGGFAAGACGGGLVLRGNLFTNNSIGARITNGGSSTVGGSEGTNVFVLNADSGIRVSNGTADISFNLIGTANGTTGSPNGAGIFLDFANFASISDNVISGNSGAGVYVYGDYGGSTIDDNRIGTNAAGTGALRNFGDGVLVRYSNGLSINGNTISGNEGYGVNVQGSSSIDINGAFIGTNAAESAAVPNKGGGIGLNNTNNIYISGNTVAGNSGAGVAVDNSSFTYLNGNSIGVTSGGTALGNTRGVDGFCSGYLTLNGNTISSNQFEGVYFANVDGSNFYGGTIEDNGGTGVRLSNGLDCGYNGDFNTIDSSFIRNNGLNGVLIVGGSGNVIYGGSITGNGGKNININNSGPTPLPNDPGDVDGGPNGQQNWPVISSVVQTGGNTLVTFALDSTSSNNLEIQAYANSAMGKAGGETFVGSMTLCGDCSEYSGTLTLGGLYDNISLTATDANLNAGTSEFSPMKAAQTAPAVSISPAVVNFGDVEIDTSSSPRQVTVRSIGDQSYVIDQIDSSGACYGGPICYGGAFICSTTCSTGTPYATGALCRFTATFAPSFSGYQTTSIFLCDNSAGSPNEILLQGNAVLPPPIHISPTQWDFGDVPVGATSEPRGFKISNSNMYGGSIPVIIGASGEFDIISNSCGSGVPANGSCNVAVQFGPTQSGAARGELVVTIDEFCDCAFDAVAAKLSSAPAAKAVLFGNGVGGGELILPDAIDVGAAIFGGNAVSRTVELRNSGFAPVTFSSVTVSSLFTLVNNCPAILEPGQACTLLIGFTAPGLGPFTGILTVVSDASGGSGEIPLSALGQTSAAPLLRLEPNSIGFGDRVIGSQSATQQVAIRNIGGAVATLSLAISTIDFTLTGNTCSATLEPAATCFAQVAFRPLGFGQRTGSLVVSSNGAGSPQAVSLSGTGCRPFVASGNRSGSSSNCAP